MKKLWKHFVAAGLAVAVIGAGMATAPANADAVKDRVAAMKAISKANKVLVNYSKGKADQKAAIAAANEIASISAKLPGMFPKGSAAGYGKTHRAKPDIWDNWAKFEAANNAMMAAAKKVASVTKMGTKSTAMETAGDVRKTCGGCHKPFRGPKPKKM